MARRVNTKFVGILGASVLGVVGAVFVARKLFIKQHPDQFIAIAKDDESRQQWADAVVNWGKALQADPQRADLWNSLGLALSKQGIDDPEVNRRHTDQAAFEQALAVDPNYVPALRSLVFYWKEKIAGGGIYDASSYQQACKRSEQFLQLAPNDPDAPKVEEMLDTTILTGSMVGQESDAALIAQTEKNTRALMAKHPEFEDLPYTLAMLDIHRGQALLASATGAEQPPAATNDFKQAAREIAKSTAAHPNNAALHFYAGEIYEVLAQVDHSDPGNATRYAALLSDEIGKASHLVKSDEPLFVDINLVAARQAQSSHNAAQADSIVRSLMRQKGSDPHVVAQAVSFFASMPDLREQAMATLESAENGAANTAAITPRRYEIIAALVDLQIDQYAQEEQASLTAAEKVGGTNVDATQPAGVDRGLRAKIDRNVQQMAAADLDKLRLVKAQARLAMIDRDDVKIIQVITSALAQDRRVASDPTLLMWLSESYARANELQQAKDYCEKVVQLVPASLEARKQLVSYLLQLGTDESHLELVQQLSYLQRAAPDDPDVIRWSMRSLDSGSQAAQIKAQYARLPEDTVEHLLNKAGVAVNELRDPNEALRVLNVALDMKPGNEITVEALVQVYGHLGRRADAIVAVEKGLGANPDDVIFQSMLKQLEAQTPDEIAKLRTDEAQHNKDRLSGELQQASDALIQQDADTARKHLTAAAAIDPDSQQVWDRYYRLYKLTKDWTKAAQWAAKLGAANVDQAHGLLYQFDLAKAQKDVAREMQVATQLHADMPEFAKSYFYLGQAAQDNGQYAQAISNYDTAIQKMGVVQEAAQMLAAEVDCYYKLQRPEQALVAIQEGRRRFPDDRQFRELLIRHEMDHGDAAAAEADLAAELKEEPTVPEVYLDLAAARMQIAITKLSVSDYTAATTAAQAARDVMQDAIKRFPDDARIYNRLSEILRFAGNEAGAEAVLKDLAARPQWADKSDPQVLLAQLYVFSKQLDKAEAAYALALTRAKPDKKTIIQSRYVAVLASEGKFDQALGALPPQGTSIGSDRQRISLLVQAGHAAEAEALIKAALAGHPPDGALLQTGWGQLELMAGKHDSAADHIAQALTLDPKCVEALLMRSKIKAMQSPPDLQGALDDLLTARGIAPSNIDVLGSMADVYMDRNNVEDATRVLEAALRADPSQMATRFRLSYILAHYPPIRLSQALQVLEDGQMQPGGERDPDLFNDIAMIHEQEGKVGDAIGTILDALGRIPGNLTLLRTYLHLQQEAGQYQAVIDAANTLLKQRPDIWWAIEARGQAKASLNDKAGAWTDLRQALTMAEAAREPIAPINIVQEIAKQVDPQRAIELARQRVADHPQWVLALIKLYHDQHQDDEAIQLLDPFVASAAQFPRAEQMARLQIGAMIYAEAQPKPYSDKAYQAYKEYLKLNPDDLSMLNNFACLCADGFAPPKVEEGLTAINHARELMTSRGINDPLVEDTYGWLLILSGRTGDGMDVIRKAIARQPFPDGYYHLGEGDLRLNQPDAAQEQANLALAQMSKDHQAGRAVNPVLRAKIEDLSNRILDAMRLRTTGGLP